jgi:transcriptional regulator with XRE-family HTH domain
VVDELDVGSQVRALRKRRGWSLTDAADRFGIGRSTLAKIESGNMSPTIGLLAEDRPGAGGRSDRARLRWRPNPLRGASPSPASARASTTAPPNTRMRLLAGELARKKMVPFRSRIKLRKGGKSQWYRHDAEEFVYVLEGAVELQSEHYAPKVLAAGDSAYLDGRMAHRMVAVGEQRRGRAVRHLHLIRGCGRCAGPNF